MKDKITMTCNDVNKHLKAFLEDLLADEEYQAFAVHLESCGTCRAHVRAIGSLSNQLWRLGNIIVPSDLASTIVFKLKYPPQKNQTPQPVSKKWAVGILVFILAALTFFFGIHYLKTRKHSLETTGVPKVSTLQIREEESPGVEEVQLPHKKFEPIVTIITPPGEERTIEEKSEKIALSKEKSSTANSSSDKDKAVITEHNPLHWHFRYSQPEEKTRLLHLLNALLPTLDYQADDLFVFTVTSQRLQELLEQITFAFPGASYLNDFTSMIPTIADKQYRISLYFESEYTSALHWHVGLMLSQQRNQVLEAIREKAETIDYESAELISFSVPETEVEKLKVRILAMRVGLSEFGQGKGKKDQLISGPVKITIYFPR